MNASATSQKNCENSSAHAACVSKAPKDGERVIKLSAAASVSQPPDHARVIFTCHSCKTKPSEAKESVLRRGEYISKIARQHGVKEKAIQTWSGITSAKPSSSATVDRLLDTVAQCDVAVNFADFRVAETVCNVLQEKLAGRLTIRKPQLTYEEVTLEDMRHHALLKAVENVREKAADVAKLFRLHLGQPISVEETENCLQRKSEETGEVSQPLLRHETTCQWPELINDATVTAFAQVNVTFELKEKCLLRLN